MTLEQLQTFCTIISLNSCKSALIIFNSREKSQDVEQEFSIKIKQNLLFVRITFGLIFDNTKRLGEQISKNIQGAYNARRLLYFHRSPLKIYTKMLFFKVWFYHNAPMEILLMYLIQIEIALPVPQFVEFMSSVLYGIRKATIFHKN